MPLLAILLFTKLLASMRAVVTSTLAAWALNVKAATVAIAIELMIRRIFIISNCLGC